MKKYFANFKFLSVIVDGSTDSSIMDNEMVYLQSCQNGVVKTTFLQCCQVQRGTAPGIVKAIERSVTKVMEMPAFLSKLIALGSDGASAMLECNAGVLPF